MSMRSEEHTSELQSQFHLVCRLLFFNNTATPEIYTLSLHDALPISQILKTKKPFISLKQPLPEANFFLYVDVSKAAIEKGILRKIILRSSLFTFLFLFGGGSVVWILVSRMGRPLQELHHAMISVGKGDLTARYHTMRLGFEINQVGGLFNKTVDQLVTHMQSAADERLKSESYRKELQIARKIQKNLFPKKKIKK